jgi:hypothetical protein
MACGGKKGVGADQEGADLLLDKGRKGRRNVAFGPAIEDQHAHPENMGRRLQIFRLGLDTTGIGRIDNIATDPIAGTNSCSNARRFGAISALTPVTPVRLPEGRLKLATRPSATGSVPILKTIGMLCVAALAASEGATDPYTHPPLGFAAGAGRRRR